MPPADGSGPVPGFRTSTSDDGRRGFRGRVGRYSPGGEAVTGGERPTSASAGPAGPRNGAVAGAPVRAGRRTRPGHDGLTNRGQAGAVRAPVPGPCRRVRRALGE